MRTLSTLSLFAGLTLAACAPEAGETGAAEAGGEAEQAPEEANSSSTPDSFGETAWLARAEDGTRFVTYFDADGTYRDMRNGDFMQDGTWSFADGPGGGQICLEPGEENSVKMCWQPDKMDGEMMTAIGPEGRRIELQRVDYVADGAEGGDAAE